MERCGGLPLRFRTGLGILQEGRLHRPKPGESVRVGNVASMQEMNPEVITQFFATLRGIAGPLAFYCCNREEKMLPDGTIVRFADYPWHSGDKVLDDALCPWHQRYYSARPPFIHSYDGPIRHRLAVLLHAPSRASAAG